MKKIKALFKNAAFSFAIFAFITGGFFTSCSKELSEEQQAMNKALRDFAFELARYPLTGQSNLPHPEKYYYPQELNLLNGRAWWDNGYRYASIERFYPEKTGVIAGSSFYNPYDDGADWVEDLIIKIEEERIANEIYAMEDALEEAAFEPVNYEEEINKTLNDEYETINRVGRNNQLKIMEYNNEIFIPQQKDGNFITIETDGQNVKRRFFDNNYRLFNSEIWKFSGASDGELLEQETYVFEEESYRPREKTVRATQKVTHTKYNDEGQAVHADNYTIVERANQSKKKNAAPVKVELLSSVYDWEYNEDGKVSVQKCVMYYYDKENKKVDYIFEKKHVYKYNNFNADDQDEEKEIPPDFEYFENGQLKMKNKYSAELGTYTSQVFFENDFAVKTYYEKYKKVKDVYTVGRNVKRVKTYE